jgi:hypothetical protein
MSSRVPSLLALKSREFSVGTAVVGGGVGAATILSGLSKSNSLGPVMVISSRLPWAANVPRLMPLGQSRGGLNLGTYPLESDVSKRLVTAEIYMRDLIDYQMRAVANLPDGSDALEADALHIQREGREMLVTCSDGSLVRATRVFFAAGVGPERTLAASGVNFDNSISPKRQVYNEVTTAIQSMGRSPQSWKDKFVTVYGGGATAAWVAEVVMGYSIGNLLWVSTGGFGTANPGGRNTEILSLTKKSQVQGTIHRLSYTGNGDAPPEHGGLRLQLKVDERVMTAESDIVVCATGSDPMAPTGVRSVLSGGLYQELQPRIGRFNGVFAATPDSMLYVVSSALVGDKAIREQIERRTFPILNPENHVIAGSTVTGISALNAVDDIGSTGKRT